MPSEASPGAPPPDPAKGEPLEPGTGPGRGPGLAVLLSVFASGLKFAALPSEVAERARWLVLDHVGNVIRARHSAEGAPALLAAVRALGLAAGGSGVFGDAGRYTPSGAAFLNAALARSLDRDDVHPGAMLHPGAVVIPAALAAAEMSGARGADLLAGVVAGYDVACRLSLALPAAAHRARGFHPTPTCGVFGAAAAAARVFGLAPDGVAAALGTALGAAGGTLHFLSGGGWTGLFQTGWAAMGGLAAATLAREGFSASAAALEGKHGFLAAFAPDPDPARAAEGLGRAFELMGAQVKSYPDGAAGPFPGAEAAGAKFRAMVDPVLGAKRAAHLAESLLAIDRTVDVAALPRLAAPLMSVRLERPAAFRTSPTGRRRRS